MIRKIVFLLLALFLAVAAAQEKPEPLATAAVESDEKTLEQNLSRDLEAILCACHLADGPACCCCNCDPFLCEDYDPECQCGEGDDTGVEVAEGDDDGDDDDDDDDDDDE